MRHEKPEHENIRMNPMRNYYAIYVFLIRFIMRARRIENENEKKKDGWNMKTVEV